MLTLSQMERSLRGAGEHFYVFSLQDGMRVLVTQRGARVLGLFLSPESDNLLWTNDAVTDPELLRAFIDNGGWNLGGERCWIAPEIQYNVRDRSDFWGTMAVPGAIDPGQYDFSVTEEGVRWEQTITLSAHNIASGEKRLHIVRTLRPAMNPLRPHEMDDLVYSGYEQTVTLSELNNTPILSAVWNLVQLNAGGTLLIPCFSAVQGDLYFGSAPDEAMTASDNALRVPITGLRQFKVGYPAVSMTGRIGYWQPLSDSRDLLLIRVFFNNPSNLYLEEPPHRLGINGHSVFVYNDGGEFGGEQRFGEMECMGRTVGAGYPECTDSFILWTYVGSAAAIRRASLKLLGVQL